MKDQHPEQEGDRGGEVHPDVEAVRELEQMRRSHRPGLDGRLVGQVEQSLQRPDPARVVQGLGLPPDGEVPAEVVEQVQGREQQDLPEDEDAPPQRRADPALPVPVVAAGSAGQTGLSGRSAQKRVIRRAHHVQPRSIVASPCRHASFTDCFVLPTDR